MRANPDPERWQHLERIFHEIADLPRDQQDQALSEKCVAHPELCDDLRALFEEDNQSRGFLESDLAGLAHNLLVESPPEPGHISFGRYRILRMLGRGGMGVVYLAQRIDLGNLVAIKVLADAGLSSARLERFALERQVLAQLNHPNIGRLYDAGELPDGSPYIVMEYVDGVSLTEHCVAHDCAVAETLGLFRSVCEAVQYAHSHALIHRDLKPSNILVTKEGIPKLLDFGLAKPIGPEGAALDSTVTGLRLMTPAYAAPEQIQGGQTTVRTDVYGLGVILYQLLARRMPFDLSNLSPGEAEQVILTREPERPSQALGKEAGAGWDDLDVLCLVAMHKDPARRYQSVEALIRDIDRYLKGEPLEARPDVFTYVVGKFVRRHRLPLLTGFAVLMTIVGLIAFFGFRLERARRTAVAEATRAQRIQQVLTHLFDGNNLTGPSTELRAVDVLDRGAREALKLGGEPQTEADLLQTVGTLYDKLGHPDRSDALLSSALEIRKKTYGPVSVPVADTLAALAETKSDEGNLPEAIKLARQSLTIDSQLLPAESPTVGAHKVSLGVVLVTASQLPEATKTLTEAVDILSRPNAPKTHLARALDALGTAAFDSGDFNRAEPYFRRAIATERQLDDPSEQIISEEFVNLGSVEFSRENWQASEKLYRQGLASARSWYGDNNVVPAEISVFLGQTLIREHKLDEAQSMLEGALPVIEKTYGPLHRITINNMNGLAAVYFAQANYTKALSMNQQVLVKARRLSSDSALTVHALYNLGETSRRLNRLPQAEIYMRDAITTAAKVVPANASLNGPARVGLGRVLVDEKRYREAEAPLVEGYTILQGRGVPQGIILQQARQALAEDYIHLGRPELAKKYQSEFDKYAKRSPHA
jgi:serine/threonine-protein kinase